MSWHIAFIDGVYAWAYFASDVEERNGVASLGMARYVCVSSSDSFDSSLYDGGQY